MDILAQFGIELISQEQGAHGTPENFVEPIAPTITKIEVFQQSVVETLSSLQDFGFYAGVNACDRAFVSINNVPIECALTQGVWKGFPKYTFTNKAWFFGLRAKAAVEFASVSTQCLTLSKINGIEIAPVYQRADSVSKRDAIYLPPVSMSWDQISERVADASDDEMMSLLLLLSAEFYAELSKRPSKLKEKILSETGYGVLLYNDNDD